MTKLWRIDKSDCLNDAVKFSSDCTVGSRPNRVHTAVVRGDLQVQTPALKLRQRTDQSEVRLFAVTPPLPPKTNDDVQC